MAGAEDQRVGGWGAGPAAGYDAEIDEFDEVAPAYPDYRDRLDDATEAHGYAAGRHQAPAESYGYPTAPYQDTAEPYQDLTGVYWPSAEPYQSAGGWYEPGSDQDATGAFSYPGDQYAAFGSSADQDATGWFDYPSDQDETGLFDYQVEPHHGEPYHPVAGPGESVDDAHEPGPDGYRGRRRVVWPHPARWRRPALVLGAVAGLLLSVGVVVEVLAPEQVALPVGPAPSAAASEPAASPVPIEVPPTATGSPSASAEPSASPPPSPLPVPTPGPTSGASPSPGPSPAPPPAPGPPPAPPPPPPTPSPDPDPPPPDPVSLEAESADRGGGASIEDRPAASGGQVVVLNSNSPNRVDFTAEVPLAGEYTLTVHYLASNQRVAAVTVNGTAVDVDFAGTGGAVGTVTVAITLTEGSNTIRISNVRSGSSLEVDRIVVAPAAP